MLDLSHNLIGEAALCALAEALGLNHTLLLLQLLPQWRATSDKTQRVVASATQRRRLKCEVCVQSAREAVTVHGDAGEVPAAPNHCAIRSRHHTWAGHVHTHIATRLL